MTQASPGRPRSGAVVATVLARRNPEGRYGVLLVVLIASYVLTAIDRGPLVTDLQIAFFLAVLLLALHASRLTRGHTRLAIAVALAGSAAALGVALTDTAAGLGTAQLWKGLMLLVTVILIVRRILAKPTVTIQSIYGALSAYIIIGLMFAAFYSAIAHLGTAPFFADSQPVDTQTIQYFSFTTLTTLGYGDFTAAGNSGRAIAVMEALTGQIFLATLVARLVSAFRVSPEPPDE